MQSLKTIVGATLVALAALASPALSQEDTRVWHHATSLLGEPKYPEGFERFDYVNPDAPRGGLLRLSEMGGFDTFNPALPQGEPATGLGLIFESLMQGNLDETSTQYGLLAEAVTWPEDFSSVTFRMNPRAKWHDGEPVTAEDVVWSFNKVLEINPSQGQYYANVTDVAVTAPGEVTFTFDGPGNRELPQIMGQVLVLPQHWWEGTNAEGETRDLGASTLEPPLGSGPYRLSSFIAGQTVSYERVEDYWGVNEPFNIGQNNFGTIRYEYFLDNTVEFEGFKGDQFDWWDENIARRWATGYDFPAVAEGRVIQELFPNGFRDSGIMVGFVPNSRLEKFQDPRVRRALAYAFDFEELNRTLFFGQYERINSFFYGAQELASTGLPEGEELEILESVRDLVPASIFTEAYANPVGGDEDARRENLRAGIALLTEAGYTLTDGRLLDANGTQLAFEVLLNGPTIEPVAQHFVANLQLMGIDATYRAVDSPQYIERVRSRDYDMIYTGWVQSLSPGNEQRDYWGSDAAASEDTRNYGGISDPGVDALIDKIIFADDRETLVAATKALDRVLLANAWVMPSYALRTSRVARWNRFSHPEELPEFSVGFPTVWWYDEEKAAVTGVAE